MKKILILSISFIILIATANAQSVLDGVKKAVSVNNSGLGAGLSNDDIVSGLKTALTQGAQKSADKLSAVNGFLGDAAVKILMPPEAQKAEKALRSAGMGSLVDNAITSMNHAAEDAAKSAAPIFVGAVKNMSVSDALGILRGSDTSATVYLKKNTTANLTQSFKPVIDASLVKTNATKYWHDVFDAYNKLPFVKKINPDLSAYVTEKAISGIFYYVAQEEIKIRKDPAGQASAILQKVFGGK